MKLNYLIPFLFFIIPTLIFTYALDGLAQETKCDCKKGGLGLKLGNFVCAIGGKSYKNMPGCHTQIGVGLGIGREDAQLRFGFGYDQGVVGIGMGFKDPENISFFGFSVGYDYGNCHMVWPYEE